MTKFEVGFDGEWQEEFDDLDEAIQWAREVAETGRTVDVIESPYLGLRRFVTAFPESELAQRQAHWYLPMFAGGEALGGGWSGAGLGTDGDAPDDIDVGDFGDFGG